MSIENKTIQVLKSMKAKNDADYLYDLAIGVESGNYWNVPEIIAHSKRIHVIAGNIERFTELISALPNGKNLLQMLTAEPDV